ncbi:hypothetical protein AAFF_G00147940 [Aldrovandia affinis]|uniref:Uncharacterized protein n=1 Tax=Aldrovandia affinis TaxID=143900 RepID=A0AAD7W930_9TELE|nr:hypothetical protein AAFF_G00147940 [Aldrovandia affinis]
MVDEGVEDVESGNMGLTVRGGRWGISNSTRPSSSPAWSELDTADNEPIAETEEEAVTEESEQVQEPNVNRGLLSLPRRLSPLKIGRQNSENGCLHPALRRAESP